MAFSRGVRKEAEKGKEGRKARIITAIIKEGKASIWFHDISV
jgi:hypothetical protein